MGLQPYVFETMGTVVTIEATREIDPETARAVRRAFAELDEQFSLYRPESEASAVASGQVSVRDASPSFRETYRLAVDWRDATDGAFTPHRPDGKIDLSGIVKAMAIQASAEALKGHDYTDFLVNAGGDVLTAGSPAADHQWLVGIVDPDDRSQLWSQFATTDDRRAVATSGIAERGEHVWRLGADDTFTQVTVAAADILTADVLATAVLAGGVTTLELVQDRFGIDVLAMAADGRAWASAAFRSA